jgi:hypothetical protein
MRNLIVCDWLQLHVTLPYMNFSSVYWAKEKEAKRGKGVMPLFILKEESHGTQQFKTIYRFYDRQTEEEVVVLACYPRADTMLMKNSGLLKICNKYLYQKNLREFLRYIMLDLTVTFVNITRLDVTMDFLKFDTMDCRDFVNGFASCKYLKKHKTKYRMMGETWSVNNGKLTGGHESLKFGTEQSDISYQLYNKSVQMLVINKPWIMDNWKSHGYDGKSEVWRLEFSCHSDGKQIITDTGEVLSFNNLSMLDHIDVLFKHCFAKHFNFVHKTVTNRGNIRKQSRSEALVLMHDMELVCPTMKISYKKDSGRSAKIFAKNLMKLNQELRGQDFDLAIMGNELATWIIKTRNIETWAEKKLPELHLSDRICEMVQKGRNSALEVALGGELSGEKIFDKAGKSIAKLPEGWEPAPF